MPDTLPFLVLGLVVGLGLIALYILSLYVRFNHIQRDVKTLHELVEE